MADDRNKGGKRGRIKVINSDKNEIRYFKDKMGITHQSVTGAMPASDSNGPKIIVKNLRNKLISRQQRGS